VDDPLGGLTLDEKLDRMTEMLRAIADDEPAMRRRLRRLRRSPDYEAPFVTSDPLVSIVIATYRSFETLRDVSLPSALAQTHRNIEVIVVGDAAPPDTAHVVEQCGDPRVSFENLPMRGPYPEDPNRVWLVSGTPPYNAGVARAKGMWIAPLADDDAFAPEHIELLLERAVSQRLEFVYARLRAHLPDGAEVFVGEFPPRLQEFGLQGALYHAGLTFMELNLADEIFDVPNDWSLCRRMMRAGVRIGMIDAATVDYYPSVNWGRRTRPPERRPGVDPSTLLAKAAAAGERATAAEEELAASRQRAIDLASRVAELERQLGVMASSKSWRITRPLRMLTARLRNPGRS
jgi:glycosyl transferase family 2